mgnify:CR=1 FL=1
MKKKVKEVTPTTHNDKIYFIRELWESAVALRGSIEPADYKRYVLPLIFIRYLSLKYEDRNAELLKLVNDPNSDYFTKDKKAQERILSDETFYREAGAFLIPKEAQWPTILANAQKDDIKLQVDKALESLEKKYPDQLKGLLPQTYAGSNLSKEHLAGLINLFSSDTIVNQMHTIDFLGQVYEYFIGEFANTEGKRGGEYFTARSVVRTLVTMLEPKEGKVFDPCCGSGGMFIQSDEYTHHKKTLSFFGQESKDFTYRLCRMNMFIHGLDADIRMGNSYTNDQLPDLKADYIISNPPFNDGSSSQTGWGAEGIDKNDKRLQIGSTKISLAKRNANYMWMAHYLYHLADGGTAGFVMANGAMTTSVKEEKEARIALVEEGFVDCVIRMPEKLFANVQIPCCLWFFSKNRQGTKEFRERKNEILFIDASGMGELIPGSRKQKYLSDEEIAKIGNAYHQYRKKGGKPLCIDGFCKVAALEEVRKHDYKLAPGIYVGTEEDEVDDTLFEERMVALKSQLFEQFGESEKLMKEIRKDLGGLSNE